MSSILLPRINFSFNYWEEKILPKTSKLAEWEKIFKKLNKIIQVYFRNEYLRTLCEYLFIHSFIHLFIVACQLLYIVLFSLVFTIWFNSYTVGVSKSFLSCFTRLPVTSTSLPAVSTCFFSFTSHFYSFLLAYQSFLLFSTRL